MNNLIKFFRFRALSFGQLLGMERRHLVDEIARTQRAIKSNQDRLARLEADRKAADAALRELGIDPEAADSGDVNPNAMYKRSST